MAAEHPMAVWLDQYYEYEPPQRGQIRLGTVVRLDSYGAFVDVGLKQEGFVPRADLDKLEPDVREALKLGDDVSTRVVDLEDREGNLILSMSQVQAERDWDRAEALMQKEELWQGTITGYNQGGLLAQFGQLRAFIPNSQISNIDRRHEGAELEAALAAHVGESLPLKVIAAERYQRRLIMSERLGDQQMRQERTEAMLNELTIGEIRRGQVRQLSSFGAFIDLDGADGMIHVSELAWRKVRVPEEVVEIGQELDVYILDIDRKRKRISLSLKRLKPDPWNVVHDSYYDGQIVNGVVTNVVDFGLFVALEDGLEGLVHVSEFGDEHQGKAPADVAQIGDQLTLRILKIEADRRRISLSLQVPTEAPAPETHTSPETEGVQPPIDLPFAEKTVELEPVH